MSKHEGRDNSIGRLVRGFQDAHFETTHYRGIPFIQNETAQSHFFRMIDFLNPEIWDDTSTNAISKEAILTLLQCAARLYKGGVHAKEAVDLIESEDTRAILRLGIQDSLSQVIHQRCVESIRSNKSEATNAKNCSRQAGLFSAIRKNKARQLNHQAMIIEHISSLCHSHGAALQNTFDSPRIGETFMIHNYITLSKTFNLCEKSWLVTLFPDIFQWESQDSCGDVNELNDGLLSPNLAAIKEANQDARDHDKALTDGLASPLDNIPDPDWNILESDDDCECFFPFSPDACNHVSNGKLVSTPLPHDTNMPGKELHGCITSTKDIQSAFTIAGSSNASLKITDKDCEHWSKRFEPNDQARGYKKETRLLVIPEES